MQMKFLISVGRVNWKMNYLIKTMAPVERSKPRRIARLIGTKVDEEDDELIFLCWIDEEDNKRDEQ